MDRYDPYTDKFIKDGTDKNVGTNDTISRQAAIKDAETWVAVDEYEKHLQKKVIEWLKEFPPAQPQRTGKWIPKDGRYYCGQCGGIAPKGIRWEFCPHCGAKMEGAANND